MYTKFISSSYLVFLTMVKEEFAIVQKHNIQYLGWCKLQLFLVPLQILRLIHKYMSRNMLH